MMSFEDFSDALKQFNRLHEVYISGGEPFLHPELPRFVRLASNISERVKLYSSGVVLMDNSSLVGVENFRRLRYLGLDEVVFSLYSGNPTAHDSVTSVEGSFARTLCSIRNAQIAQLSTEIHYVPVLPDPRHLTSLLSLSKEAGVQGLHILGLVKQGRAAVFRKVKDHNLNAVISELWESRDELSFRLTLSSSIRDQLPSKPRTDRDTWNSAFIDARGHWYPDEAHTTPAHRIERSA